MITIQVQIWYEYQQYKYRDYIVRLAHVCYKFHGSSTLWCRLLIIVNFSVVSPTSQYLSLPTLKLKQIWVCKTLSILMLIAIDFLWALWFPGPFHNWLSDSYIYNFLNKKIKSKLEEPSHHYSTPLGRSYNQLSLGLR